MSKFAIGQKVRISDESPSYILDTFPDRVGWVTQGLDREGDYMVSWLGGNIDRHGVYVRAFRLSAIEETPEVISFDEVLVGDKVRQTITNAGGDVSVKTITVKRIDWLDTLVGSVSGSLFTITKATTLSSTSTLELLSRTAKEYRPGDKIGFADLKHLKTDTVLRNTGDGVVRIVDQDRAFLVGREETKSINSISRSVKYVILSIPEVK